MNCSLFPPFRSLVLIVFIFSASLACNLSGAGAIYFSIGDIQGGSTQAQREGLIVAADWSWRISNSKSLHGGAPETDGDVTVQDLMVSKYLDKATPLLLQACAAGTIFPEAKLYVWEPSSSGQEKIVFTITMSNVVITSVEAKDNKQLVANDRRTEELTLNFKEITLDYTDGPSVFLDIVSLTP